MGGYFFGRAVFLPLDFFAVGFRDDDLLEPDLFVPDFLEVEDLPDFLAGTFLPFRRASESPMAIACLRLVTFLPLPPLLSVPRFRLCIAPSTSFEALAEYFRAIVDPPVNGWSFPPTMAG